MAWGDRFETRVAREAARFDHAFFDSVTRPGACSAMVGSQAQCCMHEIPS
jgi:hypothetical protein